MIRLSVAQVCVLLLFFHFSCTFEIGLTRSKRSEQRADLNDTTKVTFRLFTRKNPTDYQELKLNDLDGLLLSNFNPSLPTRIYAPGWNNEGQIAYSTRDEYLSRDDCNFFVIYWVNLQEGLGNGILFAVRTTQTAAEYTGAFLNFLIENGTPLTSLHLIGHSAGAHLAGGAAARVVHGKIPRISGLDPGSGLFNLNDPDTTLDVTDAEFVDIIHTNGGTASFTEPMGHVDFYVNGGEKQPGCGTPDTSCCSHCRAADLFAESITTVLGFVSFRCDSYEAYQAGACDGNDRELMGDTVSLTARGTFYTNTNQQAPWAQG